MDTSYSKLRQNLKQAIDIVTDKHQPLFITSHNTRKAVLISYDDYESLTETAYLLNNPANAKRLLQSITNIKSGKNLKKHGLIEEK
jgi:antitoxin YefM